MILKHDFLRKSYLDLKIGAEFTNKVEAQLTLTPELLRLNKAQLRRKQATGKWCNEAYLPALIEPFGLQRNAQVNFLVNNPG